MLIKNIAKMQCFNHIEEYAVGVCKNCYKAICKKCALISFNSISCSTKCLERCEKIDGYMEKMIISKNNISTKTYLINSLFLFILGIYFQYQNLDFVKKIGWIFCIAGTFYLLLAFFSRNKNDHHFGPKN